MVPAGTLKVTCTKCNIEKSETDFYFKDRRAGRRDTQCKDCVNAYRKEHYNNNKQIYIDRAARSNKRNAQRNLIKVLEYLQEHPCVDCGENDPVVLEFDHRDPKDKKGRVSEMLRSTSWERTLVEIKKCDVRCANCHRRRTARQFGWLRATYI